ncbi:hypothetical protein IP84_16750 [beta proteobacterium AAP99]|nr:hypothetical protein IP84_16750 [beta proteobacterium AAP99]
MSAAGAAAQGAVRRCLALDALGLLMVDDLRAAVASVLQSGRLVPDSLDLYRAAPWAPEELGRWLTQLATLTGTERPEPLAIGHWLACRGLAALDEGAEVVTVLIGVLRHLDDLGEKPRSSVTLKDRLQLSALLYLGDALADLADVQQADEAIAELEARARAEAGAWLAAHPLPAEGDFGPLPAGRIGFNGLT